MTCHVCGSDLPDGARFCPRCARPVTEPMPSTERAAPREARASTEPPPNDPRATVDRPRPTCQDRIAPTLPRDELAAALATRRELGAELDPEIAESFLARIEQGIDPRVNERLRQGGVGLGRAVKGGRARTNQAVGVALGSMALGIPLSGIAGATAQLPGIIVVWVGIVSVNVAYNVGTRTNDG